MKGSPKCLYEFWEQPNYSYHHFAVKTCILGGYKITLFLPLNAHAIDLASKIKRKLTKIHACIFQHNCKLKRLDLSTFAYFP